VVIEVHMTIATGFKISTTLRRATLLISTLQFVIRKNFSCDMESGLEGTKWISFSFLKSFAKIEFHSNPWRRFMKNLWCPKANFYSLSCREFYSLSKIPSGKLKIHQHFMHVIKVSGGFKWKVHEQKNILQLESRVHNKSDSACLPFCFLVVQNFLSIH
jgi:hypothetical protein